MKKLTIGLSVAALMIAGGAYAAQGDTRSKFDTDGNGVATRAEAQARAAEMFARLDANKDGKLDQADRALHMQQMKAAMFDRLDTNKDGQISRAEFTADRGTEGGHGHGMGGPMAMGEHGDGPGMEGHAMGGPGMGGSGMGGPGGMHKGRHGGRGGAHGGGMMAMARMADTNNDGAISQAEFTAAALKRFDMMDANKDGQITQQERQAGREQMKARWEQMRGDDDSQD